MTDKEIRDIEASILQRLKNYSESRREDRNLTLCNYAIERFLYRLSLSDYHCQFVLKGAQLFRLWQQRPYRPTRDLDLLRHGSPDLEDLKHIISKICQVAVDVPDGIHFLPETIKAEVVREDNVYDGVRIRVEYRIGRTGQFMQIDIGFGDAIVPTSVDTEYPRILDMPVIHVKSYPPESVIAEKVQAMVTLGIANSRMKDFFDVFTLSHLFEFEGLRLVEAIRATFERRGLRFLNRCRWP